MNTLQQKQQLKNGIDSTCMRSEYIWHKTNLSVLRRNDLKIHIY